MCLMILVTDDLTHVAQSSIFAPLLVALYKAVVGFFVCFGFFCWSSFHKLTTGHLAKTLHVGAGSCWAAVAVVLGGVLKTSEQICSNISQGRFMLLVY